MSVCGINCEICDQFRDAQCLGCLKDEKRTTCEAYLCATEKNLDCFSCERVKFCKKRRNAIDKCLVFRPEVEFRQGVTYLIEDADAALTFAKLVFSGGEGLLLTKENPSTVRQKYMLENVRNIEALDKLKTEIQEFVQNTRDGIVLVDSLGHLIERNTLAEFLDALVELNEKVAPSSSVLLLGAGKISEEQKRAVKEQLANLRTEYIVKAVSNPKRKDILNFLRHVGKSSFAELYEKLGYTVPPKLSFHLKILKEAGVIEQDREGTYYISDMGREIDRMLKKIGDRVVKKSAKHRPRISGSAWLKKYGWYLELMKKSGSYALVNTITDTWASVELILGKRKAGEVFQTVLAEYVETEREMSREDLKRMISEIAFVFLVDELPLADAINWADELLVKHNLK